MMLVAECVDNHTKTEAFPSYFMSFGISFFLSFQNCRQILNSQNIEAIISDIITSYQSQSTTVIDSVWQPYVTHTTTHSVDCPTGT